MMSVKKAYIKIFVGYHAARKLANWLDDIVAHRIISEDHSIEYMIANCFQSTINEDSFSMARNIVLHYAPQWEFYSGDEDYPVPSTVQGKTARQCNESFDIWGGSQYGDMNRALCTFIAEQLRIDFDIPAPL